MVVGKALAVGLVSGAAGLAVAFAAPASAAPVTFGCSPCVTVPDAAAAADPPTGAPWTDFFANAPWEKVFGSGGGIWENGVKAVNGGVWEKVFPPAP